MPSRRVLFLSLLSLLLSSNAVLCVDSAARNLDEDDEDIRFLEEPNAGNGDASSNPDSEYFYFEGGSEYDSRNFSIVEDNEGDRGYNEPTVHGKDVVVLTNGNFSEFVTKHRFVMAAFYAPWCVFSQALAPEYAEAATALKVDDVILAKVNAIEEGELAQKYNVRGYPTLYFFSDGDRQTYYGQLTKDDIVTWIKKKIGPVLHNLTTLEDAERILTSETKIVLGYLNSLVVSGKLNSLGPESAELEGASRLEDEINFYQTVNADVAKLFRIDSQAKRPALILLEKDVEKLSYFDGRFVRSAIADFVFASRLPLVTKFSRESAFYLAEIRIEKQIILFAVSNVSEKIMLEFEQAAENFMGKLVFVFVDMDDEDVGKLVSQGFGISGDYPKVIAYTGKEDAKKFLLDEAVTFTNVKAFAEKFLERKLKPFFKSDPIPETNDGDVKIVVGYNFDDIVLDESKDVLLEIYSPRREDCQFLDLTCNKLAKHLSSIDSLVVAKMDVLTNEHPRAKASILPTLLFFPAGNKSFEPITVDSDQTVVELYKFLKKNASIPFKIQKPSSSPKSEVSDAKEGLKSEAKSEANNVKAAL